VDLAVFPDPQRFLVLPDELLERGFGVRYDGCDQQILSPLVEEPGDFVRCVDGAHLDLLLRFLIKNIDRAFLDRNPKLEYSIGDQDGHQRQRDDDQQEEDPCDGEELFTFICVCHAVFPLTMVEWIAISDALTRQEIFHERVGKEQNKRYHQGVNRNRFRHGHADKHRHHDFPLNSGISTHGGTGAAGRGSDPQTGPDRTDPTVQDIVSPCLHLPPSRPRPQAHSVKNPGLFAKDASTL